MTPKCNRRLIFKVMYLLFVANNATVNETITDSESNSTMNGTVTDPSDLEETTAAGSTAAPSVDVTTATVSLLCVTQIQIFI